MDCAHYGHQPQPDKLKSIGAPLPPAFFAENLCVFMCFVVFQYSNIKIMTKPNKFFIFINKF